MNINKKFNKKIFSSILIVSIIISASFVNINIFGNNIREIINDDSKNLKITSNTYIYKQSSNLHKWYNSFWIDDEVYINEELSGNYFIIYTARCVANDLNGNRIFDGIEGLISANFMLDQNDILTSKRYYQIPGKTGNGWGASIIISDIINLNSEQIKVKIDFDPHDTDNSEQIQIIQRSLIAIPLGSNLETDTLSTSHTINSGSFHDYDIGFNNLDGNYLMYYIASYEATGSGVGYLSFEKNNIEISETKRYFEIPEDINGRWHSTFILADRVNVKLEDINPKYYWSPYGSGSLIIKERTIIAIPLGDNYGYGSSTNDNTLPNNIILDNQADIESPLNGEYIVFYTSAYEVNDYTYSGFLDLGRHGWGTIGYVDNNDNKIGVTTRQFEVPVDSTQPWYGTLILIDKINFDSQNDLQTIIQWNPDDDEVITIRERSMIAIPFYNIAPEASASSLVGNSVLEGQEIPFSSNGSNDPDGIITLFEWDFGDGGTSTDENPTYVYNTKGNYIVNLTVTDNFGSKDYCSFSIEVEDDDITAPLIEYSYTGDYTDGNPGTIIINAFDESGLLLDPSGIYVVPNSLGAHTFIFNATDADLDNSEDTLTTSKEITIVIQDDDTVAPTIDIKYIEGNGYDNNPGTFIWEIYDTNNGIGGDNDNDLYSISIIIDYYSSEGKENQEYIIPPSLYGSWDLPPFLGEYRITISAIDNDDDRTIFIDSLTTEVTQSQIIVDDDILAPQIKDIEVNNSLENIELKFKANDELFGDDSGLSEINIYLNNVLIINYLPESIENEFEFLIKSENFAEIGTYILKIEVWDSDNDREGDSLMCEDLVEFEITLNHKYEDIITQIRLFTNYIQENLHLCLARFFVNKLYHAINNLEKASEFILYNKTYCALIHDLFSQSLIIITEFKTEIFNQLGLIENDTAEYIISITRMLRYSILNLMGLSIGTSQAMNTVSIIKDLYELKDIVNEELEFNHHYWLKKKCCSCCWQIHRGIINFDLDYTIKTLYFALIKLSLDIDIKKTLDCIKLRIEYTKYKIMKLYEKEKISEDLYIALIMKLDLIISKLE